MTRRCPWKKRRPAATPPPPQEETTRRRPSTSSFVECEHVFHIVGYSARKALALDANSSILSGAFLVGGHTWALDCGFDDHGHLASVSVQLLTAYITDDVVAKAGLRIEHPLGRCPAAVWLSDGAYTFPARYGRTWTLPLPDEFYGGREACFVQDDRLTIVCTLEVLQEEEHSTIAEDFHKLLPLVLGEESESENKRHGCMLPDVTFLVEQTEIQAHRLVLAMRSPVFAAELLGDMRESTISHVRVDDISASTFRAMLRFIYTDELPIKAKKNNMALKSRRACKAKYDARRRLAMACDLLVAADLYDLGKLRLMCEEILSERMDVASVMPILLVAHGRYNCRQLEAYCIEYLASDANVYAAVKETQEYQELEENYCSFIAELVDKVATHKLAANGSSFRANCSSWCPKMMSMSTYNTLEVIRETYEFRIPNFSSVRESHAVGQEFESSTFIVGGYKWVLYLYPSGASESLIEKLKKGQHIPVYVDMLSDPGIAGVRASACFRIDDPSGKSPSTIAWLQSIFKESSCGFPKFTTVKDVKSRYLAHDGSLTIRCDIVVTNKACIGASGIGDTTLAMSPNIRWNLEQLLASGKGSDVTFLVEERKIQAHRLVIATRSPVLYEVVGSNEEEHVVIVDDIKFAAFKAVIHFIYTDKLPPIEDLDPATMVSSDDVIIAGEILSAACRFRLEKMKAMCENILGESASSKNVSRILKLARHHQCSKLEDHCTEFYL
ncbi:hypothetical protein QYE76_049116 [Lolium multiflorum]|uniref:Speckle-type POZ protein n=1 Tax=Lolium multiflorum TaxID=4521 RepID=A0AAD8SMD1_LOLMU|nr:hypothetical protein QYE76_049116 [Lolium multiflorum]